MFHPSELIEWSRTRDNRPDRDALDERAFWSLYACDGLTLREAPSVVTGRSSPSLLFVLTTYRRPGACRRLLESLHSALAHLTVAPSVCVLVLNDHSDADYGGTRACGRALFGADLVWLDARERLGKPGFWRVYQTAFLAARALEPVYTMFLQDDVAFAPTMVAEALARFEGIGGGPAPCVLNLFSCHDDEPRGRWVHFRRRELGHGLRLTQWFDLNAFLVDRRFFTLLAHTIIPIHPNRWRRRPRISSGVGRQLTRRLFRRGDVFQVVPSLVRHGAFDSEMNPEARRQRALDNRLGGSAPSPG